MLTDEELARAERQVRDRSNMDRRDGVGTDADVGREANEFWFTRRPAILNRRTSLITDPPDGKIPPVTPEAKQSQAAAVAARRERGPADSYEDRNLTERCILREPGPPILPTPNVDVIIGFTFQLRILQNADYVAILSEVVQQARIIPLDGRPHLSPGIRQWVGDSRGRWEGNTLVVETTNLHDKRVIAGFPAGNAHLVERFTRVGANAIDYQFTVNDPTTWTQPWSAAVSIEKTQGEIYEFACHEGNYSITNTSAALAPKTAGRRGKERDSGRSRRKISLRQVNVSCQRTGWRTGLVEDSHSLACRAKSDRALRTDTHKSSGRRGNRRGCSRHRRRS